MWTKTSVTQRSNQRDIGVAYKSRHVCTCLFYEAWNVHLRLGFFDWITRINVFRTWFAVVTGFWHVLYKQTRSNLILLIRDKYIFVLPDIALELNFATLPLKTNIVNMWKRKKSTPGQYFLWPGYKSRSIFWLLFWVSETRLVLWEIR